MLVPLKGWTLTLLIIAVLAGGYYRAFERLPLPSSDDQRVRTELAERWDEARLNCGSRSMLMTTTAF